MLTSLLAVTIAWGSESEELRTWGLETIQVIRRDYWMPKTSLYAEEMRSGSRTDLPSFDWGVGVMLSALNGAAKVDPSYRKPLKSYIASTRVYWNPKGPVPGYDVQPMPKTMDRYYDDNEWMTLSLAESGGIFQSAEIYGLAEQTFAYVQSGFDDKLGGGVYWRETDRSTKNTCSNGPAASAALELYNVTHLPSYLKFAEDSYDWTRQKLRDPSDGLYFDSVNLKGGVDRTKWSYNAGLMLRAAVDLYRVTQEKKYLDDAKELQMASLSHWVDADGGLKDDGKFVHLLLENWIRAYDYVPGLTDPMPVIVRGLTILHRRGRDSGGQYGTRWNTYAPRRGYSNPKLIDQASAARAYLEAYMELSRRTASKNSKT